MHSMLPSLILQSVSTKIKLNHTKKIIYLLEHFLLQIEFRGSYMHILTSLKDSKTEELKTSLYTPKCALM